MRRIGRYVFLALLMVVVGSLARWIVRNPERFHGVLYRLRGQKPDPEVDDLTLADRIRSELGPLEKRLDLPHVHVMAEDHVVLLHGDVEWPHEAAAIEHAVRSVSGVHDVESHLHVGLLPSDTRPSTGALHLRK